jgi:hypothetical protein
VRLVGNIGINRQEKCRADRSRPKPDAGEADGSFRANYALGSDCAGDAGAIGNGLK